MTIEEEVAALINDIGAAGGELAVTEGDYKEAVINRACRDGFVEVVQIGNNYYPCDVFALTDKGRMMRGRRAVPLSVQPPSAFSRIVAKLTGRAA